jgi:hypothetical protein
VRLVDTSCLGEESGFTAFRVERGEEGDEHRGAAHCADRSASWEWRRGVDSGI